MWVSSQLLYALLLLVSVTFPAGVSIHSFIAVRTHLNTPSNLKNYWPQYLAGSFHPDAFYNCFHSEAAEAAHWPPFIDEAIKYLQDLLPYNDHGQEYRHEYQQLEAFIYGIITHQVADISWHSLRGDQGLLKMIANVEFDGDIEKAHNYLDTAGDFIILHQQFSNLSGESRNKLIKFLSTPWEYPSEHILNIYSRLGYNITPAELKFCMHRGYTALQSEISAVLSERTSKSRLSFIESPLTVSVLEGYYYGGIEQIIAVLEPCMFELKNWISNRDNNDDPWNFCRPVFSTAETKDKVDLISLNGNTILLSSGIANTKFGGSIKFGHFLGEPSIAISAPYEESLGAVYLITLKEIIKEAKVSSNSLQSMKLSGDDSLSYPVRFGDKLFRWFLKEYELLIVSQPGLSSFKVFLGNRIIANLQFLDAATELGSNGTKQINILSDLPHDINNDGYPDIIIGSMYSDSVGFQSGKVYALDGQLLYKRIKTFIDYKGLGLPPTIDINSLLIIEYKLPQFLEQLSAFEQFGTSFTATNDYAIIGINSIGGVVIFEKSTGKYVNILTYNDLFVDLESAITEFSYLPSRETSMFAYHKILSGSIDGKEWLLISAAGFNFETTLSGIAYLYEVKKNRIKLITKLSPYDMNHSSFFDSQHIAEMFSSNMLKLSESLVVISSNGYKDGCGGLYLADISQFLRETKKTVVVEQLYEGHKDIGFTNFASTSMEFFSFEGKNYLALSLSDYFYAPANDETNLTSGSVLIIAI